MSKQILQTHKKSEEISAEKVHVDIANWGSKG